MTEYHVEYRIEVDAESPEEAARKVAAILAGGGAGRGVYHVAENHLRDQVEEFDLSRLECNGCKRPAAELGGDLGYGPNEDLCYECFMRYTGNAICPGCNEWRQASEINSWESRGRTIRRCESCVHNIRRSGGNLS